MVFYDRGVEFNSGNKEKEIMEVKMMGGTEISYGEGCVIVWTSIMYKGELCYTMDLYTQDDLAKMAFGC